ncbi:hypothetical protein PPERSA_04810 [Pseudocohnilembus persalinus]|uniref:RING-type domain-containing protein n=1 Tax=Pseudocohnilembus persalinus TaxID=266149 RepID=A0A0V0QLI7_PSEPJ|nr:hypothetical protein PPERSA_04810 [Pseudocohnilembus persalinus]|eukprot:KRX03015.1 hypothetical protein PPERSA_04810 [Pseudocohnilembus persalinus]
MMLQNEKQNLEEIDKSQPQKKVQTQAPISDQQNNEKQNQKKSINTDLNNVQLNTNDKKCCSPQNQNSKNQSQDQNITPSKQQKNGAINQTKNNSSDYNNFQKLQAKSNQKQQQQQQQQQKQQQQQQQQQEQPQQIKFKIKLKDKEKIEKIAAQQKICQFYKIGKCDIENCEVQHEICPQFFHSQICSKKRPEEDDECPKITESSSFQEKYDFYIYLHQYGKITCRQYHKQMCQEFKFTGKCSNFEECDKTNIHKICQKPNCSCVFYHEGQAKIYNSVYAELKNNCNCQEYLNNFEIQCKVCNYHCLPASLICGHNSVCRICVDENVMPQNKLVRNCPTCEKQFNNEEYVEYALNAVAKGETALGIKAKDGVVIAVEKKTSSVLIDETSYHKVQNISNHIGAVYAGISPDFRILTQEARQISQKYQLQFQEPMLVSSLCREVASIAQEYTQMGGVRPFGISLLTAGYDDQGPHLYQIDPSGAFYGWKATAIGKNQKNARTFLEKRYNPDMGIEDAIHTALLTLKEGFEGQMNSSNIEVGIIKKGKDSKEQPQFVRLTPAQVKDYLDEVE